MNVARRGQRTDVLAPQEVQLLRAAGLADADLSLAAWSDFRKAVPEGQESVVEQRLLPVVCRNLRRVARVKDDYLTRAYANSLGANARMLNEAAGPLTALHAASIPTMVLKGSALLIGHYRDLGARPMSDVDLFVPHARIEDALDVFKELGWRGTHARSWLNTEMHATPLTSPDRTCLDLHRHVTYEARFPEADDLFLGGSSAIEVQGAPTRAMSAGAQLLHGVVHGLRWSIAPSSIWVIDAATLLRGGSLDVKETLLLARRLRLEGALRAGLEVVRATLGGETSLQALLDELRSRPPRTVETIEQRFRVRAPSGLAGALPNLMFAYQRSHPEGQPSWSGFPAFLRQTWQLEPTGNLTSVLAKKLFRWRART